MNNNKSKNLKGFTLVEIMLAITLFVMIIFIVANFSIDSLTGSRNASIRTIAVSKVKEIQNAINIIKNDKWSTVVLNTDVGPMHIEFTDGTYTLEAGELVENGVTYSINIKSIQRDINGDIVESGGTVDPHTRSIEINASWQGTGENPMQIDSEFFVNDWSTLELLSTTKSDFDLGTFFQARSTSVADGEISLQQIIYPDWCKPALSLNEYDIPGAATAKTLFSYIGETYLGTGGNSTGVAFTKLTIEGIDNPTINVEGEFNGYLTNNIFVLGDYAYLGTTNDSKEVVILDISATPYTEVGYFNTSRTDDANSVYVVGNIGYVAAGKYVYTFDVTSKTGSRTALGSIKVSLNQNWGKLSAVSQIVVKNNYLFASLDEDWYELAIVNVANPASMNITSQTSVNNQQTFDIYVSENSNRTYFGTGNSSSEREFFILDTTSKSGARPIIGRYDTNGMSVNGIAIIEKDKRAVLVGKNGEEYQAVNISNEASPVRCGGMQLDSGINDIDSVSDVQTNSFSYILTANTTKDFLVLRGGPGLGGDDQGYGYPTNGEFESRVYDTGSASTYFYLLDAYGLKPSGTDIKIQIRTGTTSDLSSESYRGPDGTTGTYFNINSSNPMSTYFNNKQYFQYKVILESDTISTPRLDEIKLTYQK